MKNPIISHALTPVLPTLVLSLSLPASGADGTWTNPFGGSWASPTNWATEVIADGAGSAANFSTLELTSDSVLTLDGNRTISAIITGDTSASGFGWTLATGTGGVLTFATGNGTPALVNITPLTISAPIAGTAGFTKSAPGTLTLSGVNTFSGPMLIGAGTVKATVTGALGAVGVGNETLVGTGGSFDFNGVAQYAGEIFRISGNGTGTGALVNTGPAQQNALSHLILNGDATVGGTGRLDIRNETAPQLDLAGHTLTKTGTNQFSIVGPAETAPTPPPTITAGHIIINEGILGVETRTSADANGSVTINPAGVLGLWANVQDLFYRPIISNNGTIRNLGSSGRINSPVSIQSGTDLFLDGTATTTFYGTISGTGDVVKTGGGTFELPENSPFVGKTTISAGQISSRWGGFLGPNPTALAPDFLILNGGGLGTLHGGFFFPDGGPVLFANQGITLGENGGRLDSYGHANGRSVMTLAGPITGAGALTKAGGGAVNFGAVNSFTGGITVENGPAPSDTAPVGALQFTAGSTAGTGTINFTNTASLNAIRFLGSSTLSNEMVLSSVGNSETPVVTRFIANSGATATLSGAIGGGALAGTLLQFDGGTFVLNAPESTYTTDTRVATGRLLVESNLFSAVTVASGAEIGGTGEVYQLTLEDGAVLLADTDVISTDVGGVVIPDGASVKVRPRNVLSPGNHSLAIVNYGESTPPPIEAFVTADLRNAVITDDAANDTLRISYETAVRTWSGAENEYWDINFGSNWVEGDQRFFPGDAVVFNAVATPTTVILDGKLEPFSTTINGSGDYTFGSINAGHIAAGPIVKNGTGTLTLSAPNTFTTPITVNGGTLKPGTAEGLGFSSGITLADGAALDINGQALNAAGRRYSLTLEGEGPDGLGALVNSGAAVFSNAAILHMTLTGDTTIGGTNGRYDIGFVDGIVGTLNGNGHTLTKIGTTDLGFRGDASGTPVNIVIAQGNTWAENTDNAWGGATGTLTVKSGARAGTYGVRSIPTPVTLEDGATLHNQGGGAATWTGTIGTSGFVTFDTAGNPISLTGQVTGGANVTKAGAGVLTVAGAAWSGSTTVSAGTLSLTAPNPNNDAAGVTVASGAVLNLNFSGTDKVDSLTVNGTTYPDGIYSASSPALADVITGTGTLTVGDSSGDAFSIWAGENGIPASGTIDSDGDGIVNGIEFVIGGKPSGADSNSAALLPEVVEDGSDLVFTFRRTAASVPYLPRVEYGEDLAGWTPAVNGENGVTIVVTDDFYDEDIDRVVVRISRSRPDQKTIFARLTADIP